ncbi:conserved hypothetical protein,hypothetical protein [Brugia malayi]|uniref:Moesin/ezrin/radixin homolog 1 n=1 Tax=Brugia malayi TaxID=6279 RepID=A0A4E9FQZ8_BRUMA|nr:conserved hypothetical protein,hypothetical protein [Brugia malayi]VIO97060.1 conserved hypothetical protein,hypothetical protein [Brugia malayi]
MGKKISEGELCDIQQAMGQQPATVQFLDSTSHIFYVSKKAEGGELFDKVCAFLDLTEKDYFGLCFADGDGNQQWIYDDKRISKQLKGHPWDFHFKVKFYPPEPATLAEDKTRHLLTLQVRHDISTGRLPATLATHALLGSYVAQSVRGDYEPSLQYIDFLRNCHLAPIPNEILYEKVEELHKNHKGETSAEAELHYLENVKKLSMYGVQLFHAKDGKSTPVQIGISAHGINIYLDQIRVHRFLWQNIIKIGYRRNIFIIKVKPGELEKNESTAAFKLHDYEAAKRVWKCGVEHHTFFRLIQPEEKPHRGLFRWGSARFRYQGRTQFQSKMASQMFCNNQPIQRSQSVRVAQNDENVAIPASLSHTLPLVYSENGAGRKLDWNDSQIISPEKIYSTHIVEATQNREKDAILNDAEVGNTNNTSGKLFDSVHSSAISTTANTAIATDSTVTGQYFEQSLSPHISSHSTKITHDTIPSMHKIMNDHVHCQTNNSYESSKSDIYAMRKGNMGFLPVEDKAVIYHPGHYEEEMIGSKQLHEPPVEPGDDFVLVHKPKLGSTGKIFHRDGTETNILIKEEDIEAYPIHRFADIYHSGFSRITSGNKENLKAFKNEKILETDDIVDKPKVNKEKYPTSGQFKGPILHTERSMELPAEPLRSHTYVYNKGYYDSIDSSRKDIDENEKGNIRNWLRCYKKSEKSQAKLLKEKDAEIKGKKLINGDHTICKSETENEQENKAKEVPLIHVKQPGYERQAVQTSYYNVESSEKNQGTKYLKKSKVVAVGAKDDKSFDNDIKEEACESMQPKQICHLFIGTSDSSHIRPGAYGVPSTSYDELLHIIKCEEELPFLPIHEHVMIYHPGISVIKDKKRRKFLIGKERKKTTSSGTSTDEEMQSNKGEKCKAILDISEADKNDLAVIVDDAEKRPIDEGIKRKCMMHEMKEKDQKKVDVTSDSVVQKITVKKDMKLADSQNVKNGSTRQKMKAIFHRSEDQNKLRNLKKETAVPKKPKESNDVEQKIQPAYNILGGIGKSVKMSKRTELLEQSQDNTPPPLKLSRISEISFQPLHLAVKVQNQMQNLSHNYRTFKRAKHKGDVEFIAKENINPESYKRECTPYQGPLESTNYVRGLQFAPIHEYSAVYHPGHTYVKSSCKVNKRRNTAECQNQEKSSILKTKKIAALNLNTKNSYSKHHEEEKSDNESKNDDQVTAYSAKIICKTPLEERRKVKKYSFKYRRISGDVEIVEKPFVKPETYNLVTISYDTPLSCLECEKELSFTPLQQCVALYHSGFSHKKAKRLRDSSTESSSNTSFSSSSSTSSTYVSEKTKELKKKVMLHLISKKHNTNDVTVESSKHKRIFPFWRKTIHSEKEGKFADDKKEKLDISSKFHPIQHQQQSNVSVDCTASQTTSSPSQIITTVLKKDPVEKTDTSLHVKNENKKLNTNLYKKEPLGTSEYDEDNGKRGKFGLFHFWRSTDKENNSKKFNSSIADMNNYSNEEPMNYTTNLDSFHRETNIRLTTKGKKKPITYIIEKDISTTDVKTNELAPSINMKDDSLNHTSSSDQANIEMKKNTFIHLKCDTELADNSPLNSNSNAGIVTLTGISSPRTNEDSKSSNTEKSQLMDKENNIHSCESIDDSNENNLKKHGKRDYVGYIAKVKVKQEMRNVDENLQQSSNLRAKEINTSDNGVNKRPSFIVKGFHLRGPPGDSEPKIASHNGTKYKPEKNTLISENVEASGVAMTKIHEANFTDSANNKPIVRKEVAESKVKKKSTGSDVTLKENKKDNGKNIKGNFFSSFWRGNKSDEHQKQQKVVERNVHETEVTPVEMTSPSNELEYNILRTKTTVDSIKPSSDITHVEQQTRQKDFVPVYDFSFVPSFPDDTKLATETTVINVKKQIGLIQDSNDGIVTDKTTSETGEQRDGKLRELLSYRSKDMEECNDILASSEDQNDNLREEQSTVNIAKQTSMEKTFVTELSWEKLNTETEIELETFEAEKLFHRSGISAGEALDEPFKFTQTPPDIPVLEAHSTDLRRPGGFVEQIERQVMQVITKTSPSSDIEKSKKEKKTSASLRESENFNASEIEIVSHDSHADKSDFTGELLPEEAKLDDRLVELDVDVVPAIHPTNIDVSLPYTCVEMWQETMNDPKTVVTTVDHQGNITKKTIKKQQMTHTMHQQAYQASNASSQNGDFDISVIDASKKLFALNGNENMTSLQAPIVETVDNKLTCEPANDIDKINGNDYSDIPGELVSSHTVTQGNRTIETITYKTEKNGTVETHVEHRVTIHSCDDIDHDAELTQAILEATNMNPDMTVEKIEVKHESQC